MPLRLVAEATRDFFGRCMGTGSWTHRCIPHVLQQALVSLLISNSSLFLGSRLDKDGNANPRATDVATCIQDLGPMDVVKDRSRSQLTKVMC